jgi:hypothetical protein
MLREEHRLRFLRTSKGRTQTEVSENKMLREEHRLRFLRRKC